jgi:hypothetical protein
MTNIKAVSILRTGTESRKRVESEKRNSRINKKDIKMGQKRKEEAESRMKRERS